MINPAISWFEIAPVPFNKSSAAVSGIFNNNWLCRYPRPRKIIYDNGSEFKKDFKQLCKDFGLKSKPTTVRNPQANAILERVHQVVGNMLRTKELEKRSFTEDDPWGEVLASIAWAIQSTYHTTLGATPAQLVYGRDMLHDVSHVADWELIRLRKQKIIDNSTARENAKRIRHDYAVGDKVLINEDGIARKLHPPREGLYTILQVYINGTVKI